MKAISISWALATAIAMMMPTLLLAQQDTDAEYSPSDYPPQANQEEELDEALLRAQRLRYAQQRNFTFRQRAAAVAQDTSRRATQYTFGGQTPSALAAPTRGSQYGTPNTPYYSYYGPPGPFYNFRYYSPGYYPGRYYSPYSYYAPYSVWTSGYRGFYGVR